MGLQEDTSPQGEVHVGKTSSSPKPRRQSEDGDIKPKMARGAIGSGPGRKSRACMHHRVPGNNERATTDIEQLGLACKKLKMKCEVFPGDRKCKHCQRRNAECVFKTTKVIHVDSDERSFEPTDRYE